MSSDGSATTDASDNDLPVELLVTGRTKRATAGNRLSSLVTKEQDDEIGLLFAENEQEEDGSFDEEEEDASDVNLEGSSEEDEADVAKEGDFAGEKDLQRQSREETKKRKKMERARLPGVARKRVKIDPTALKGPSQPQPRPKKKSERISWVATAADAPTRVSSRKQTVKNREIVHQKLVDSQKQRVKLMRQMAEAQKRKEASKPQALTQAQRMEEAAKIEKKNAKSLTRWEESEKQRITEQKAKLEALHQRQLSGPVITWWSGLARWANNKIAQLGIADIRKAGHEEETWGVHTGNDRPGNTPLQEEDKAIAHMEKPLTAELRHDSSNPVECPAHSNNAPHTSPQDQRFAPSQATHGFLEGIHDYAALSSHQGLGFTALPYQQGHQPFDLAPYRRRSTDAVHSSTNMKPQAEFTSRNLVALKNIDANNQKSGELVNSVLVKKSKAKPQREICPSERFSLPLTECFVGNVAEQCTFTGQSAIFREPKTDLLYANVKAYKQIQQLREGIPRWSNMLECFVGSGALAARGVPERFQPRVTAS